MKLGMALTIVILFVGYIFLSSPFNPVTGLLALFLFGAIQALIRRAARHDRQNPSYPSLKYEVFCDRKLP